MLYLHLRLIQSALGQKVEAEPVGNHRGRSQGRATTGGREVASFPGEVGPPLGQSQERASPFRVKFDLSAYFWTGRDAAYAVSGAPVTLVVHATTPRTQHVRFTDEVPRCPVFGRVSPGYKSHTKGQGHASETGTAFPGPALRDVSSARVEACACGLPLAHALKGKTSECRLDRPGPWDQLARPLPPPNGVRGPPPVNWPVR